MSEVKLEIKDYYVFLNLHKALLEAKFHANPDNILVCLSPIIADFCNQLIEKLAELDAIQDEKKVDKWEDWRKLEKQPFYKSRAIKNAALYSKWLELKNDEKIQFAKNILSPFKETEDGLIDFIKAVDEESLKMLK